MRGSRVEECFRFRSWFFSSSQQWAGSDENRIVPDGVDSKVHSDRCFVQFTTWNIRINMTFPRWKANLSEKGPSLNEGTKRSMSRFILSVPPVVAAALMITSYRFYVFQLFY
ncbi:uncharacterized protein LOC122028801 isoform X2 [Zingiber officinale]|uniref:uncharacterized protein LOC122028801 isoform X2 n=1 Tax=Zingiber officinale TaxID=94328 RepID=UPI001C4C922A|nr:uncharacterized protein LOC122028801 isoform X2 [Zingiber officinale]